MKAISLRTCKELDKSLEILKGSRCQFHKWFGKGIVFRSKMHDGGYIHFADFENFFSDLTECFIRSFNWRNDARPPSIYYYHSGVCKLIELGIDGSVMILMPHEDFSDLDLQGNLFRDVHGIFEGSDLFDNFTIFRPIENA